MIVIAHSGETLAHHIQLIPTEFVLQLRLEPSELQEEMISNATQPR